ncbi:tetratricopeptide repeat protein [Candidatus Vallotia cooleyia]|uniref:tetratricopeptide repeat protein n=1 Tax=Candidatus Vallotiella adelgis TaxID=1177211 RepID=UPI003B968890|nr:hypothetical protein GJV44_00567 [Candidatus Vallotia cooleyia]
MNTIRNCIVLTALSLFSVATTKAHTQALSTKSDSASKIDYALSQLDEYIRWNPRDAQARFKRANLLMQLDRDDDAMTAYKALTQTYPELPEPYNNLASIYAKRGKLDEARVMLETAVHASPGYALAQANLGDLYLRLAAESFEQARALEPHDAYSAKRSRQIMQLFRSASAGVDTVGTQ